jgi:hypothetical protein
MCIGKKRAYHYLGKNTHHQVFGVWDLEDNKLPIKWRGGCKNKKRLK